jgi:hypothetical protein
MVYEITSAHHKHAASWILTERDFVNDSTVDRGVGTEFKLLFHYERR